MSRKQNADRPVKLSRAEKREIQAIIRRYKGDGKPHTAQESIPYEVMYQDGVCRLNQRSFSKCIEFSDTNYQLAQPDDRTATFEYLCDLYNYVDASIHVQFSFVNRRTDPAQYARSFEIAPQGDDFDDIRAEHNRHPAKAVDTGQQRHCQNQVSDVHHRGGQPESGAGEVGTH